MNDQLQAYARAEIKAGLAKLPVDWQMTFKQMYAHGDTGKPINAVVDAMPANKLNWAMQQVSMSIKKIALRAAAKGENDEE